MIVLGLPLDPDPDSARAWLGSELAKPEYAANRDWLTDLIRWVLGGLRGGSDAPNGLGVFVAVALVTLIVGAVVWWAVRAQRVARVTAPTADQLLDASVDPEDYRASARRALADGDWDAAVVASFGALVAQQARHGVLEYLPGRTAREAADLLVTAHPAHADALKRAASSFDVAAYGMRPSPRTDEPQARATLALDAALSGVRTPEEAA